MGEDFCVQDYEEMKKEILHYYQDKEYHKEMSEKAKKRAEILLDSDGEFKRILREMDKRENGHFMDGIL